MKILVILSSILFSASLAFAHCGSCGTGDEKPKKSCSKGKHKKKGHKCDKKECSKKKHKHGHKDHKGHDH